MKTPKTSMDEYWQEIVRNTNSVDAKSLECFRRVFYAGGAAAFQLIRQGKTQDELQTFRKLRKFQKELGEFVNMKGTK